MINSLYLRLNLSTLVVMIGFLGITGAVLDNAYLESARLSVRERMLGQIYPLLNASGVDASGKLVMPLSTELPFPALALPNSGLYAFVGSNFREDLLWRSPSLRNVDTPAPINLKAGEQHWSQVRMRDGNDYYLLGYGFQRTLKTGVHSFNFFLMAELAPMRKQITAYRQRLWGGLFGAAALLIATQLLVMRWGLRPLRKVGLELNGIEQGKLDRINGRYPREVKQLTDNINNLLIQERTRQTQYRNALDDLAHSLKTPLAVLLGAAADHPETLVPTVNEQTARMMKIVERQLQRAGALGHSANARPIAVSPLADRITASLSKVYRTKHPNVLNRIDPELSWRCDETDLMEILGNLLDNAFKWCHEKIEIQGYKTGRHWIIGIHDDGPGIDAENRQKILQRGGRADEYTPGHGFGLSIAAEIIAVYQGRLRIDSSHLGGAAVIIEFWK